MSSSGPSDDWIGFVKAYREKHRDLTYAQSLILASKEWKKPEVKEQWCKNRHFSGVDSGMVLEVEDSVIHDDPPVSTRKTKSPAAPLEPVQNPRIQRMKKQHNYQEKYYQLKLKMAAMGLDSETNLPE